MLLIGKILFWLSVLFLVIALSAAGMLIYIVFVKTKQVTEFLAVTDWFGRYSKISQRIRFNSSVVRETRAKYKDKPIREMLRAFGNLFEEDFKKLFPKLERGVTYRVVTHYTDVIEKAKAEHKIVVTTKNEKITERFLKELRPLVGWRDYQLIKRCVSKHSNEDRCCKRCVRSGKCKPKKGNPPKDRRCPNIATKTFTEYYFVLADDHKE